METVEYLKAEILRLMAVAQAAEDGFPTPPALINRIRELGLALERAIDAITVEKAA